MCCTFQSCAYSNRYRSIVILEQAIASLVDHLVCPENRTELGKNALFLAYLLTEHSNCHGHQPYISANRLKKWACRFEISLHRVMCNAVISSCYSDAQMTHFCPAHVSYSSLE